MEVPIFQSQIGILCKDKTWHQRRCRKKLPHIIRSKQAPIPRHRSQRQRPVFVHSPVLPRLSPAQILLDTGQTERFALLVMVRLALFAPTGSNRVIAQPVQMSAENQPILIK